MSKKEQYKDLFARLTGKPSQSVLKAIIAVTFNGIGFLFHVREQDKFDGIENFFDGALLSDNLTDDKNVPTETGMYICELVIESFRCNIPEDPVEYDMNMYIRNVKKLELARLPS